MWQGSVESVWLSTEAFIDLPRRLSASVAPRGGVPTSLSQACPGSQALPGAPCCRDLAVRPTVSSLPAREEEGD